MNMNQMNMYNLFNNYMNLNNQNMNNFYPQNYSKLLNQNMNNSNYKIENNNNNYNISNNNTNNWNKEKSREETLPRDKEITLENPFPNEEQTEIINVIFESNTGSKINISFPINKTLNELILYYAQKLEINVNLLGKSIIFIFSGRTIHLKDKIPLKKLYSGNIITVLETYFVVGG